MGEVHFAENPVAEPFSFISPDVGFPVAVVYDGQTPEDVLPVTDSVRLYWQGTMDQGTDDEGRRIAVTWDLEPYREQLNARERVLITGSYPEAVAFQPPVCLVVFQNGKPAAFLNGHGAEAYGQPVAIVNTWLEEPELGCRFEWSQDGGTWLPAGFTTIPNGDGSLRFKVTFPQEEPPAYPYYLSAVVDYPDGGAGYSDVIVFTWAGRECGSGGNRGGGTDITDPPNVLDPNPPDDSGINGGSGQEPELPENSGGNESESPEPDSTPGQQDTASAPEEPEQTEAASEPKPAIQPAEEIPVIGKAASSAKTEPDLQDSPQFKSHRETTIAVAMPPRSDSAGNMLTKAVSIVIGGAATAAVLGAAGLYHSESLRKRLRAALKKLKRSKK